MGETTIPAGNTLDVYKANLLPKIQNYNGSPPNMAQLEGIQDLNHFMCNNHQSKGFTINFAYFRL
jgi:hypothetical protein